jgi:flagellar protein FlaG
MGIQKRAIMGIQNVDGRNSAYLPSYTAQGAAGGTVAARSASAPPAADPGNPVQQQNTVTHTSASPSQLEKATAQAQARLRDAGSDLSFSIDKESGKTVVKLIDPATQEVIRQIPSKEMLAIADNLGKTLQGFLINQQA